MWKHLRNKINQGYSKRPQTSKYVIVIHSTNGKANSSYASERSFLYASNDVSAHFLISKDGIITQFLPIHPYAAWHAGAVTQQIYTNDNTIGIECHYTPGESKDMPQMYDALSRLVRYLQQEYNIPDIVMHRSIAYPLGRKVDPSFWNDSEFAAWKQSLDRDMNNNRMPLLNAESVSLESLVARTRSKAVHLDTKTINYLVSGYSTMGVLTNLGNLWPFAQAVHETGWFTSERFLKNNNMAGLGATNDGAEGAIFPTITHGIYAQYAHLLCYATKPEQNTYIIESIAQASPRITQMSSAFGRGCATHWEDLNGKWAYPGTSYAQAIEKIVQYIKA